MQNYHKHTYWSNIFTPDSAASIEEYAKRAVELGHKILSSVEHGWQGYYFQTYEIAKKYNLKCVIGAEAYWVRDRIKESPTGIVNKSGEEILTKDNKNNHIIILAKNNKGREALNDILSEASISGYYYKPRIDLELLLKLPPNDVFITTACVAFNGYNDDNIILSLHNHFKENFMLEIQYHNTEKQKEWNKHLLKLSNKYGIELIVGLDSHYILEDDSAQRDIVLDAKGIHYNEEEGWFMDYPEDEIVLKRFLEQGIFTKDQIIKAMNNTNICLSFDDYDDVPIFKKDIKLPTIYPNLSKDEKDKIYSKLISKKFKEYMKNIPKEEYDDYYNGVKLEVQTYKDTGMVDYPLLNYAIVKDAVEHGGLITDSGRGSAVSYFTNTLCGFSKVDRFKSDIKLYPERFISTTRILETKSLPDIDLNVGTVSIFEDSQKRILGDNHAVPMIAFGTLKKKSAFKLYARAKEMNFELANEISNQISAYDEAIKYADDEDKELIDIYDYVDEKYREYIEQSEEYWGIISDKKKAPSAYLLYQGDIRKEIGLIKCKSESTKKEYITCVIDGAIAENYKFLKNDILKVDVVLLIDKVFKRIGIEHFNVNTLLDKVKEDKKVWDIYSNGYTIGINQIEKDGSRHKCKKYKPSNISELAAFIAAIRPGFRSMYSKFENREDFSWGIKTLDNLIRTEELPVSFLFFQEQVMMLLNYAGFPMDECYGIIKAIAKKHPEKIRPLKSKFIKGFKERIILDEQVDEKTAQKYAEEAWIIVNDNSNYSFNSSHAYCMALDSAYQAWQKANYPYEFYEVNLQHFSDKGKKDKVTLLKNEMKKAFGINEGLYKFRKDNRTFTADKENHCINPALSSLKGLSTLVAEEIYTLSNNKYDSFIQLLIDINKLKINSAQLDILIRLDYFSEFGEINQLLKQVELFNLLYEKKQFNKSKLPAPEYLMEKYATKITEKQYKFDDTTALLTELCEIVECPKTSIIDKIKYQKEYLGYIQLVIPKIKSNYYYVEDIDGRYANKMVKLYQLNSGEQLSIKVKKGTLTNNPLYEDSIIKVIKITEEKKWGRNENGEYYQKEENEPILKEYVYVN